jgi:hypothetical protein
MRWEKKMSESTTIMISRKTKKRLEKLGDFNTSWDELLIDMADFIEEHEDEWFTEEEEEEE